jgi:hypothetical protein
MKSEEKRRLAILTEAAGFPLSERIAPKTAMIANTIIHPSIFFLLRYSSASFLRAG